MVGTMTGTENIEKEATNGLNNINTFSERDIGRRVTLILHVVSK
jgi:hypothetical protein